MQNLRWVNPYHPQTLNIGVILLYIDGVFAVIGGALSSGIGIILAIGAVVSGVGIANDKRWAWYLGVAVSAIIPFFILLFLLDNGLGRIFDSTVFVNALFPLAQLALLVHPMSRSYVKIYFDNK